MEEKPILVCSYYVLPMLLLVHLSSYPLLLSFSSPFLFLFISFLLSFTLNPIKGRACFGDTPFHRIQLMVRVRMVQYINIHYSSLICRS